MNIQISWTELSSRGENVRKLLKPICRRKDGPAWTPKQIRREFFITTHEGSPPSSNYQEWRFKTIHPSFQAQYFERWMIPDKKVDPYLDRAYLHIFKFDSVQGVEKEFLCLHCDPNEPTGSQHTLYKQSPHLHIKDAADPIPKSHIALCLVNLPDVLSSLEALDEAMEWCILMVKEQFLDLLR